MIFNFKNSSSTEGRRKAPSVAEFLYCFFSVNLGDFGDFR